ncbi:MAG: DUF2274 domain-containing protein [Pseudomonadota bacterium]
MVDLKLHKLPKTETIKLTIVLPAQLFERLEQYADVYSLAYGDTVGIKRLVPHMLDAFLVSDRAFQHHVARDRSKRSSAGKRTAVSGSITSQPGSSE